MLVIPGPQKQKQELSGIRWSASLVRDSASTITDEASRGMSLSDDLWPPHAHTHSHTRTPPHSPTQTVIHCPAEANRCGQKSHSAGHPGMQISRRGSSTEAGGPKVRPQSAETSADGRRTGHNSQRSRFPFLNTLRKGLASLNSSGDPEEGRATLHDPASKFHVKDTLVLGDSHNNEFSEKSAWKPGTVRF